MWVKRQIEKEEYSERKREGEKTIVRKGGREKKEIVIEGIRK